MPKIFQVDSFTTEKFKGNPAAVCLLDEKAEENWMQAVAAEMNLSETAFVSPRTEGYDLRWFTPTIEVDLCGHATLAAAFVLFEEAVVSEHEVIEFHTRSGLLSVSKRNELLEMDFPAEPPQQFMPPPVLTRALGVTALSAWQNKSDILIEVADEQELLAADPDFQTLSRLPARGIIVTSPSDDPGFDFKSRFFAPRFGINEDPVTGSAHCCLGPFWALRLEKKEMRAYQASKRGGVVHVAVKGERVTLSGHAVMVMKGELI